MKRMYQYGTLVVSIMLISISAFGTITLQEPTGITPGSWDGGKQFILTSLGTTYTLTSANLQTALNSVNGTTNGTVWIPAGSILTITSTINIWYNITLDLQGSTIKTASNIDMFYIYPCATLTSTGNVAVLDAGDVANYNKNLTRIMPYDETGSNFQISSTKGADRRTTIEHLSLIGENNHLGNGMLLYTDTGQMHIGFCRIEDIYCRYFKHGIWLRNDNDSAWVNANHFNDIRGSMCDYFIYLNTSEDSVGGNIFNGVQYQPHSGFNSDIHAIYLNGDCDENSFSNVEIWDWSGSGDTDYYINLTTDTTYNTFYGSNLRYEFIDNDGSYNAFYGHTPMLEYINMREEDDTGIRFYFNCINGANPKTWFYGDDGGTDKFLKLFVDSDGTAKVTADTGENLYLASNQGGGTGYVEIDDVLKLTPRVTEPNSPSDGMIYYNGTSDHFYGRCNGAWVQLDN